MQLQKRKIADLKSASYNPIGRTDKKKLAGMIKSIEAVGLIYPIAITKSGQVIDGHRRLAAVKEMGWEEVPVVVVSGDAEAIYASVASATRRLNGNEALQVYLKEPLAISDRLRGIHEEAEKVLGRELLQKMAKQGTSITMYRWGKQIAGYVNDTRPEFIRRATQWSLKYRNTRVVIGMINLRHSPDVIRKAVINDKPINATYTV